MFALFILLFDSSYAYIEALVLHSDNIQLEYFDPRHFFGAARRLYNGHWRHTSAHLCVVDLEGASSETVHVGHQLTARQISQEERAFDSDPSLHFYIKLPNSVRS